MQYGDQLTLYLSPVVVLKVRPIGVSLLLYTVAHSVRQNKRAIAENENENVRDSALLCCVLIALPLLDSRRVIVSNGLDQLQQIELQLLHIRTHERANTGPGAGSFTQWDHQVATMHLPILHTGTAASA